MPNAMPSATARARRYTGPALKEIAFPLGGIGTGTVSLGGRGQLRDWEIFNRPAKGRDLPLCFFAIRAEPDGGDAVARILERRLLPPFIADRGLSPWAVAALPRLEEATFVGTYPIATVRFHDPTLPVEAELEAFTPFAPLDDRVSGLPVAVFLWRLRNPGNRPVDVTLAYTQLNPVGYDGVEVLRRGRRHPLFGGNVNQWTDGGGIRGLRLGRPGLDRGHPGAGGVAVATAWREVTFSEHWERSGWFDDVQSFWDDFRADGRLPDRAEGTPSPPGETDAGTLGLIARIAPSQTVELPIVLAWHFPSLVNYWGPAETLGGPTVIGQRMTNWFATQWRDAWAAARETLDRLDELAAKTRAFRDALFASTLPEEVIDAVSSQMSIIRTTTCLRTADGRFHAFEGCDDNAGCCPMNCSHVWNYAQALAFLFPQLERSVRLTDYQCNTLADGEQKFRTMLPLQTGVVWNYAPAADGQMGTILKLYREWLVSGDDAYLRALWPRAKQTLAFAWTRWDPDRDGVMEGEQHNTYDVEFYGPNTMCGALYLGALRAAEEIARYLGDPDADEYARIYASGRVRYDRELWNGEYYAQQVRVPAPHEVQTGKYPARYPPALRPGEPTPRYQYGPGCLSDQLLGQWFAHVVGLGYLLPEEHVRTAARSIFTHNFRRSLEAHESCQRGFAVGDEGGLLQCTWPRGGRPRYPFPYADECWTGAEYAVAGLLVFEGEIEAGLEIVRAVRRRHDGVRRNPWDEFECGHHYARALSSWALLLALSGCRYSAPAGSLRFDPRVSAGDFRCVFTAGTAWGVVEITRSGVTLAVQAGELALRRLEVGDRVHAFEIPVIVAPGRPLTVARSPGAPDLDRSESG
jgi:non-lysosomal glucosylceramidase